MSQKKKRNSLKNQKPSNKRYRLPRSGMSHRRRTSHRADPPKAPPSSNGYKMVFAMLPSGQYSQNMCKIQPICQAIGENDLDPFWEDIKSVDWYNVERIRTAMQRRSSVLCVAMCVMIVAVNVALAMNDIVWAFALVTFPGCLGFILGNVIIHKAYMKKIHERTRQITLKATNYNNDLLKEKNLKLVVEVVGDWITLEYILTPMPVHGQGIPGLDFG
jgi:hypothetical protein